MNMKKNALQWMLMAALTLSLSMSFTACSDDDDKKDEQPIL
jgi:hypothetical protein